MNPSLTPNASFARIGTSAPSPAVLRLRQGPGDLATARAGAALVGLAMVSGLAISALLGLAVLLLAGNAHAAGQLSLREGRAYSRAATSLETDVFAKVGSVGVAVRHTDSFQNDGQAAAGRFAFCAPAGAAIERVLVLHDHHDDSLDGELRPAAGAACISLDTPVLKRGGRMSVVTEYHLPMKGTDGVYAWSVLEASGGQTPVNLLVELAPELTQVTAGAGAVIERENTATVVTLASAAAPSTPVRITWRAPTLLSTR